MSDGRLDSSLEGELLEKSSKEKKRDGRSSGMPLKKKGRVHIALATVTEERENAVEIGCDDFVSSGRSPNVNDRFRNLRQPSASDRLGETTREEKTTLSLSPPAS